MKKSIFSMAAIAIMMVGAMSSCTDSPYAGYEKNQNGLYYKFYSKNEGGQRQIGELMDLAISCSVNDSLYVGPTVETMMLYEPLFKGDIFEGLAMMHKGDSASFIVDIDSTFITFFGRTTLPEGIVSTDVMRFDVRMDDIYPESEYRQRMADRAKAMQEERIASMKNDHPEETAKAAQELSEYLVKNKIEVEPTESGLYYVMTQEGNGEKPTVGQVVKVHYTGKLLNGTVFDSSVERGEPISIPIGVGQVIPGWDEGIMMMSKGEKGVLYIPYYLAYGERAAGDKITPFSNLMFEVELIDFQ